MTSKAEAAADLLTRTCGRCGHARSSHNAPAPDRGVGHSPPQACHVRRGCTCLVFTPAREWCSPPVRALLERRLERGHR